MSMKRVFLW